MQDTIRFETDLFLAMVSGQLDHDAKQWDELPKLCNLIMTTKGGKDIETSSWWLSNGLVYCLTSTGVKRAVRPDQVASVAVLEI